jgi:hypothetical protein
MLRDASRYADEHPAAAVLVVCHSQEFCGYLRKLAQVERLSPRLTFVPSIRARDAARGRRGEFYVDHAAWRFPEATRQLDQAWGALVNMRMAES